PVLRRPQRRGRGQTPRRAARPLRRAGEGHRHEGRVSRRNDAAMKRPNIVYIVCDDLGYADLGCYGGRQAGFGPVSPNIDALAAGGLKFTEGYSNSPVCSPTRFAIMTMRYQYRLRGAAEEPINSKARHSQTLGLPPDHP